MRFGRDDLESALRDPGFGRAAAAVASSSDPEEALRAQLSSDIAEVAHPTGRRRVAFRGIAEAVAPRVRAAEDRVVAAVTNRGGEDSDVVRGIISSSKNPERDLREFLTDIALEEVGVGSSDESDFGMDGLGNLGMSKKWKKIAIIGGALAAVVITAGAAGAFVPALLPGAAGIAGATAGAAATGGVMGAVLPTVMSVGGSLAMSKLGPKPPKTSGLPSDLTYDPTTGLPYGPGGGGPATKTDMTPYLIGGAVLLVAVMALKK